MIKVRLKGKVKELDLERVKLERLLNLLGINPEDVLVIKSGKLITEDYVLKDGDEIEIFEVVSQG